jgi:P pilus assembly chaperone PapD
MPRVLAKRESPNPATAVWLRLLAGFLVLAPSVAQAFGVGLSPTTVELEARPGARHRQLITVGNVNRNKALRLSVGLADWSIDDDGKLLLAAPASTERSAADWVRFSPATLYLKPGEAKQVVVDIQVPVEAPKPGDLRFAVLVSTLLPSSRSGPSGVWSRYQVSSLFYVTLPPAASAPRVVGAELLEQNGRRELVVSIENPGNRHARLSGELALLGADGEPVHTQPINGVVMDRQTRRLTVPIAGSAGSLPPGRYRVGLELSTESGPVTRAIAELPVVELSPLPASAQ